MGKNSLINKILLTKFITNLNITNNHYFSRCEELESEGFGMLADKNDPSKLDENLSVVFPDGTSLACSEIKDYWEKKPGYSSKNPKDVVMHKARVYCLSLVEKTDLHLL